MGVIVTQKALDREKVMRRVQSGHLRPRKAGEALGLCRETLNRPVCKYRAEGIRAPLSKRAGKRGGHAYDEAFKARAGKIVGARIYTGFGPTLMSENLRRRFQIKLSRETLRKWMTERGLWKVKRTCAKPVHVRRRPRAGCRELVQTDGSPHDWFEGRAPKCCLIVFIDDAGGHITAHFAAAETSFAYMECLRKYIDSHALPAALYHDRRRIFSVSASVKSYQRAEYTQFGRVMHRLGIASIPAYSPQAKGRAQRANAALQDRFSEGHAPGEDQRH